MIGRLHVAAAVAVGAAILTAVLVVPIAFVLFVTITTVPYDDPSAFDFIVPPMLFALLGVPGIIAALIVRGVHPDGDVLRPWIVLLTSAAGVAIAIAGLYRGRMFGATVHMSVAMRMSQAVAGPFLSIFEKHDLVALLGIAAGAALGAAAGALLTHTARRKTTTDERAPRV